VVLRRWKISGLIGLSVVISCFWHLSAELHGRVPKAFWMATLMLSF